MAKTLDELIEGFNRKAEYYRDDSIISSEQQQVADLLRELRQLRCSTPMHQRDLIEEVERLTVENTKLRGMLEEAWGCIKFGAACAGCGCWYRHGNLCKLMCFLRDIGIEVDPDVGRYGY